MSCHIAHLGRGVDWVLHDGIDEFLGFEDVLFIATPQTGVQKNACE